MAENANPNPDEIPNPKPNPPPEALALTVTEEPNKPQEIPENKKTTDKVMIKVKTYGALISITTIILSLPILASAIWLFYMKDYDCEKLLRLPKLQTELGIGLIFVFLISNFAVFFKARFPIPSFFIVMIPLIVILTVGLALVGSNKIQSRRIKATPMWFKDKVGNDYNWRNIESCIFNSGVCEDLASRSVAFKAYDFSLKKLSSVESGCCNPPGICEMEYVNATYWKRSGDNVQTKDCNTWGNDRSILCYGCDSCRDGYVKIMESKWWKLGVFLIIMALLLILAHLLLFVTAVWERYNG